MSEVASPEVKPKLPRSAADKNAFAEVERWMALIREISLDQVKTQPA
jgi:hypothetical protein